LGVQKTWKAPPRRIPSALISQKVVWLSWMCRKLAA